VVEWWSDGVVEWWSGGVVEWWSGGVVEWWSGGVVEWWGDAEVSTLQHSDSPPLHLLRRRNFPRPPPFEALA
jgi:hypothetical protein